MEDDVAWARLVLDYARQAGFKGLIATRGEAGLALVRKHNPHGLILDLRLPDMDGWVLFDRLTHDPRTRHIPVQIMSVDEGKERGLSQGAFGYLVKPATAEELSWSLRKMKDYVEKQARRLLVVEADRAKRQGIVELIGNGGVQTKAVASAREAVAALKEASYDCLVLDPGLPDMNGFLLIENLH